MGWINSQVCDMVQFTQQTQHNVA